MSSWLEGFIAESFFHMLESSYNWNHLEPPHSSGENCGLCSLMRWVYTSLAWTQPLFSYLSVCIWKVSLRYPCKDQPKVKRSWPMVILKIRFQGGKGGTGIGLCVLQPLNLAIFLHNSLSQCPISFIFLQYVLHTAPTLRHGLAILSSLTPTFPATKID